MIEPTVRRIPVCGICRSGHPPIEGDGAEVCYPCILRRGRMAAVVKGERPPWHRLA